MTAHNMSAGVCGVGVVEGIVVMVYGYGSWSWSIRSLDDVIFGLWIWIFADHIQTGWTFGGKFLQIPT